MTGIRNIRILDIDMKAMLQREGICVNKEESAANHAETRFAGNIIHKEEQTLQFIQKAKWEELHQIE